MTKIIGLTGGIGSGKSTIANFFSIKKIPVYIADEQAREITNSSEIIYKIKQQFGNSFFEDGILNRQLLANLVFDNPQKLKSLNNIIHPAVKIYFEEWFSKQTKYPFVLYESAILFESGNYTMCDYIITVTAPIETRIERVVSRDKTTEEQVLKRINNQWTDQQRIEKSDFVIENINLDSSKNEVEKILKILNIY